MEKELTFEQAIARLNEITNKIQSNDCSLDEGLKLFEEGIQLSSFCNEKLEVYQQKLEELQKKQGENND